MAQPVLRAFQRADVEFLKSHALRVLLASSPGVGKTIIAVRAVAETPTSLPCIVACPASVSHHWRREFNKWAVGIPVVVIEDTTTKIERMRAVYVVSWSLLDDRLSELLQLGARCMIGDEAHYTRNPDALRSQAFSRLAHMADHVLLLTGTPIINIEEELSTLKDLLGTKNPPMIRRLLEDVAPDIPPKRRSVLPIRLRPRHQDEYDRACSQFEAWLRKEKEKLLGVGMAEEELERTLAAEAFAKIGYLRRLVGEYKVPAALDFISSAVRIGEPIVVFFEHQAVLTKLSTGLKRQRIRHGILDGAVTAHQRQVLIDGFQANKFPVFLGSKAAKEGITLTAARHTLFVERYFTSAEEEQSEDRTRRIGQYHKTTMWYLHAVGTVDDRIDQIVRTKRGTIRTAIGSADVMETPLGNVESLIKTWSEAVAIPSTQLLNLGNGDPLPPLPSPRLTHAVVFYGDRWRPGTAIAWCKMNGYNPLHRLVMPGRLKLITRPAQIFKKGSFEAHQISKEIRVITGERLGPTNEREMWASLGKRFELGLGR